MRGIGTVQRGDRHHVYIADDQGATWVYTPAPGAVFAHGDSVVINANGQVVHSPAPPPPVASKAQKIIGKVHSNTMPGTIVVAHAYAPGVTQFATYTCAPGVAFSVGDYVCLDSSGEAVPPYASGAVHPAPTVIAPPWIMQQGKFSNWLGPPPGDDEGGPPATARSATAVASPPPPANCQRCGEPNAYGAVANYPATAPTLFRCWSCRKYHGAW